MRQEPDRQTVNFAPMTVLVVDDDAAMCRLVRTMLNGLGITRIREVDSVPKALAALAEFPVNLIITDLAMRPVDGITFVRRLRTEADSPDPRVPIVMITGHTDIETVRKARDAGVDEFIAKPITAHVLHERIVEVIENPRPFVHTPSYVGPDRRRRDRPFAGKDRRRQRARLHRRTA